MSDIRRWELSSLELSVLLAGLGRDRLPVPLTWRSTARTRDELQHRRRIAASRVDDPALREAASVLVHGDRRVTACGLEASEQSVRIHASVRGSRGVLVVQHASPDDASTDGDMTVSALPASAIPRAFAAALPTAPPGRAERCSVERAALSASSRSVLENSARADYRRTVRGLLAKPLARFGDILVGRSSRDDAPIDHVDVGAVWIDVQGDGRYLVTGTDTLTLAPASTEDIAALIAPALRRPEGPPSGPGITSVRGAPRRTDAGRG